MILGGNDDPELKQRCFNEGTIRIDGIRSRRLLPMKQKV